MIRLMAMGSIVILMELSMKVIGKRISNMDKVLKHGQMELNMMDSIFMERSMDKEDLHGLMAVHISALLKKIIFKDMVPIIGQTEDSL
jgi:hypothetical protein